jgi:hypothetical protein
MNDVTGWPQLVQWAAADFVQVQIESCSVAPERGNSIKPGGSEAEPLNRVHRPPTPDPHPRAASALEMGDSLPWATVDEGNYSDSARFTGFESNLSPTSVGSDLLIDSVQGFRR